MDITWESAKRDTQVLLVVAEDPAILVLARAVLAGKGYRVLVADCAHSAVRVLHLEHMAIHFVIIRHGMGGWEQIWNEALARGAEPWMFWASIQDGIIQIKGLEGVTSSLSTPDHAPNGQGLYRKAIQ